MTVKKRKIKNMKKKMMISERIFLIGVNYFHNIYHNRLLSSKTLARIAKQAREASNMMATTFNAGITMK